MSTDEKQPNMQARHRSNCYALRSVRPGQLNRLCYIHVNQQAELADSKGAGLEFEATSFNSGRCNCTGFY